MLALGGPRASWWRSLRRFLLLRHCASNLAMPDGGDEGGAGGGRMAGMRETLDKVVGPHMVMLFMKGTEHFPQRDFSHTVVQTLRSLNVPFETQANEALRQGLKEYSSWPTFT